MMMILNPAKKKKRKYTKKRKTSSSKKRTTRKKKACYRTSGKDAIRRWACSPKRARNLSASDAYNLCGRRDAKRWKPKLIRPYSKGKKAAASEVAYMGTPMFNPGNNPGGLSNMTAAFKPRLLMGALPIAAGVLLNYKLTPLIASRLGVFAQSGIGNVATGLGAAGLSLLIPGYGAQFFAGGMVRVMLGDVIPMIKNMILPPAPMPVASASVPVQQMKDLPIVDSDGGDESDVTLAGSGDDDVDGEDIP